MKNTTFTEKQFEKLRGIHEELNQRGWYEYSRIVVPWEVPIEDWRESGESIARTMTALRAAPDIALGVFMLHNKAAVKIVSDSRSGSCPVDAIAAAVALIALSNTPGSFTGIDASDPQAFVLMWLEQEFGAEAQRITSQMQDIVGVVGLTL